MNKKIIIPIAIVAVIAIGAYLAMTRMPKEETNEINTRLADDSKMAENESLRDLLTKGKALECRVVVDGVTNKFYIADKKMRSDFATLVNGKKTEGHMIVSGDSSYTWMEGEKTGFKVVVTDEDKATDTSSTEVNKSVDLDSKIKYDCESWSKDDSYFEVPQGVVFSDLSSMIPTTPAAPVSPATPKANNSEQCAACNNVPSEMQAQCKTSLGCK